MAFFMKIRINTLIEIIVVTLLFFSLNPFLFWIIWPAILNLPLFVLIIISTLYLITKGSLSITWSRLTFSMLLILFSLYAFTPILGHSWDIGKLIYFFSAALVSFYPHQLLINIFLKFRRLMIFFCIFSLAVFFITLTGIQLPYYKIPGFSVVMTSLDAYYKLYGVVVSSTNTIYNFSGITIARICGPFLEPGHFAIYLGIVSFFEKALFDRRSPIIIATTILTFSPAALFFIVLIYGYDWFNPKGIIKNIIPASALVLFATMIFFLLDQGLQDSVKFLIFDRNFSSNTTDVSSILDERAGKTALPAYENFRQSQEVYFGRGVEAVANLGVLSDIRGLIFKFGLIGLSLSSALWLSVLTFIRNVKVLFLVLAIIILIGVHRSWMFESIFVYMIMFIGYQNYNYLMSHNLIKKYS